MVIIFSVLVSGTKGRNSRNPGCFFRIGSTSLRTTFTNSSFFSSFGINSTIRANMMDSPFLLRIGATRKLAHLGVGCLRVNIIQVVVLNQAIEMDVLEWRAINPPSELVLAGRCRDDRS